MSPISEEPPDKTIKIPVKLNGCNFVTWSKMLKLKFKSLKLWDGKMDTPFDTDAVLFALLESLDEEILDLVIVGSRSSQSINSLHEG
jgi:hypothetical protein